MLSRHRLHPSILTLIPEVLQASAQSLQVNWQPWSEFMTCGQPCRLMADCRTSMQFDESSELLRPHPTMYQLYTPRIAVKYMKPLRIGM